MLGAVIGFVGGATVGYGFERRYVPCQCDDPGLGGLVVGAVAGSALAVPVAVHLANGRRGSLARALGASALIGTAGLVGVYATAYSSTVLLFLLGTPLVEVGVSVRIERATARAPER